jgi:hypothetical protein
VNISELSLRDAWRRKAEERLLLGKTELIEVFDESMDKSGRDKSCPYKFVCSLLSAIHGFS